MDDKKNPIVDSASASAANPLAADAGNGQIEHIENLIRAVRHPHVTLERTARPPTEDEILWMVIRNSTNNLGFASYSRFLDSVLCGDLPQGAQNGGERKAFEDELGASSTIALPFPGVDPYRLLKVATEVFLMIHCGVKKIRSTRELPAAGASGGNQQLEPGAELAIDLDEERARLGHDPLATHPRTASLEKLWENYLQDVNGATTLPYLDIILQKLPGVAIRPPKPNTINCYSILQDKLARPCFVELIWSYWQEEGMLVQTMNAIGRRFQNRRAPRGHDPLAQLELDPLFPLNNLFWGYLQDEHNRLSVFRRAHEYEHQYGCTLQGRAVRGLRTADSRSKFLEAFHNLIYQCILFYRQDDDTTVNADGFAVLNAIRETHYILGQGAHNQFGDLPMTARQEMLIQQWLLSRPEMRQFLGGRLMVPYPEPWMDRADAMKSLQGWTDTSVVHFNDLAIYGEQLLLSIRYGDWSNPRKRPDHAANWARSWRAELKGYAHAYRAATGVDLTTDLVDQRAAADRFLPPSVHLRKRLMLQRRK